MPKPDDVGVGTAVIILNEEGEILLGRRKGAHRAGTYCVPGGWMDREDPSTEIAAIREVKEETDLEIRRVRRFGWTTEDHPEIGIRTVTLYHIARAGEWAGVPEVLEPEKCDGWAWYLPEAILNSEEAVLFPGLAEMITKLFNEERPPL